MARSSSSSRSRSPRRDGRHHSDRPRAPRDRESRSPQASSVRARRSRRSPDDFSTAVGLLRDATSLLAKKKDSDRPVSLGLRFRSTSLAADIISSRLARCDFSHTNYQQMDNRQLLFSPEKTVVVLGGSWGPSYPSPATAVCARLVVLKY